MYNILRAGIIKDVPQDIDIDDLMENIDSPTTKVLEVHRLNHKVRINNAIQYVPSCTLYIKLAGQTLPKTVAIFYRRYSVFPYKD